MSERAAEMIVVSLTWSEGLLVGQIACMRQLGNRFRGIRDKHGADPKGGWNEHVEGVGGEMAVAKYFGLFYSGSLGDFKAADVGDLQVRTGGDHRDRLILHGADGDDDVFVLVTGLLPNYAIRGWVYGREGKEEQYWDDPRGKKDPSDSRPAFFVPQSRLRRVDELFPLLSDTHQRLGGDMVSVRRNGQGGTP